MLMPRSVRIFVCTQPQDMRRGFDTLALAVQQVLGEDPRSGALFVFTNRRRSQLKALWWDRSGYCILYKRLHRALFQLPKPGASASSVPIDGACLAELLRWVATRRGAISPLPASRSSSPASR